MIDSRLTASYWRILVAWLVMFSLYGSSLPSYAQTAVAGPDDIAWLCWMAPSNPPLMRCIQDISDQPTSLTIEEADASQVIELLQARFEDGATVEELERLFQLYSSAAIGNQLLTIPLHNFPFESSWREKRPQKLLSTLLCNKDSACRITLRLPQD